jgi:hypothetical protein
MGTRIGHVDLCTSHPGTWIPVIRGLGYEPVACWDSGETRPEGFAGEFAKENNVEFVAGKPEDMIGKIDIAVIHSANWDKHIELAKIFVDADIPVLLDKPVAGNVKDINQILDLAKQGKVIAGGSSLRFTYEVEKYLAKPEAERGKIHAAFSGCSVDEYNYGIHAYALLFQAMGCGVNSVQYIGSSMQKHIQIKWKNGNIGYVVVGEAEEWMPSYVTIVTGKGAGQIVVDTKKVYKAMLEKTLPYLAGKTDSPPFTVEELVEPELAAIAARKSWMDGGKEIFITDLHEADEGYDGRQFAVEYRRARS